MKKQLMTIVACLAVVGVQAANYTSSWEGVEIDAALDDATGAVQQVEFVASNTVLQAAIDGKLDTGDALTDLGGGSGTTYLKKDGTWDSPAGGTFDVIVDSTTNSPSGGEVDITASFGSAAFVSSNNFAAVITNEYTVTTQDLVKVRSYDYRDDLLEYHKVWLYPWKFVSGANSGNHTSSGVGGAFAYDYQTIYSVSDGDGGYYDFMDGTTNILAEFFVKDCGAGYNYRISCGVYGWKSNEVVRVYGSGASADIPATGQVHSANFPIDPADYDDLKNVQFYIKTWNPTSGTFPTNNVYFMNVQLDVVRTNEAAAVLSTFLIDAGADEQ